MRLNKWKYLFKSYFNYSVREQHAIIVLMTSIACLQFILLMMHFVPVNGRSRNEIIPSGSEVNAPQLKTTSAIKDVSCSAKVQTIHPFKFNPNLNKINDWKKLGLTEKQAQCIMKYVAKGGTFKSKSDLKKMRVIRSELLEKWWDYIQLPDEGQKPISEQKTNPVNKKTESKLNINTASLEDLDKLPLIGEGRAKAIISYRDRLGGYVQLDQLLDLKCIPDSVYSLIATKIETDGQVLKYVNLNSDSINHPYLPKQFAKMLVSYRQQHGNYQRIEDLRVLPLYDDKIIRKIAPYLKVNP